MAASERKWRVTEKGGLVIPKGNTSLLSVHPCPSEFHRALSCVGPKTGLKAPALEDTCWSHPAVWQWSPDPQASQTQETHTWTLGTALARSILRLGTCCGRTVDQRAPHSPILGAGKGQWERAQERLCRAALSPGMYLTVAGMAGVVHICEVLPVGIHEAMVGAAFTAGAAGT